MRKRPADVWLAEHLGIGEHKIEKNLYALFEEMDGDGSGRIDAEELDRGIICCHEDRERPEASKLVTGLVSDS